MRVVDVEGEQVGIMKYEDARQKANEANLDLVLVAEKAQPPVCRIMDFGKLVFEQKKKLKEQRRHHHTQKQKEVKFRVNIDPHDYKIKINHVVEFLGKGYKVKITLMFRGREMAHKDIGFEVINQIIEDLKEHGHSEDNPKLMGRNISVNFTPVKGSHH